MESNTNNGDQTQDVFPSKEDLLYPGETLPTESVDDQIKAQQSPARQVDEDQLNDPEIELEIEIDPVMAAELDIGEVEILDDAQMDGSEEQFNLELDYYDVEKQEEKLWQARTGLNNETLCGAIETVIFMSDKPVAISRIKTLIDEDMPLRVIHESIERLQEEYEQKHHGLRLVEVAEGYQFRTKATYSKYVQDLFKVHSLVLSPTALEVLAIIAYKQPVSKVEVEKIRGVDSSHIIRGLMDKRLVRVCGRSEEMGRPVLYGTTPEFLEVFNLSNIEELPPEHELESMAESGVGKIGDIKTIVHDGDKEAFVFDEIDELDQLTEDIKNINSDTDFIQSLKVEEKKRISNSGEEVRSAFDLLEEYLDQSLIKENNIAAAKSELFTAVTFPEVISDLEAGPFNVPDEEDEEFEMIDLDTGEPIIDIPEEAEENTETDDSEEQNLWVADESDDEEIFEINLSPESDEDLGKSLSDALDKAFEGLTGENINAISLDSIADEEEDNENLSAKRQHLEDVTENILDKAADLDIDLSFLKDGDEKSTQNKEDLD